ncbi:MAG: B12-binding domain-containing radical SAM protein [Firmicutes bacterium]|nr:B12-binding domain-containing radical SAM protein [Bacillota bacterium]
MPFKIIEHNEKLAKTEKYLRQPGKGGAVSVCLVYPNRYYVGMSNLGFLSIFRQISEHPDYFCDRAFLPDPDILPLYKNSRRKLMGLLSEKPIQEFDIIAFSVSFEMDYLNIPKILELAGIPCGRRERNSFHPLIIAGGAAVSLNPEIISDYTDVFAIGEAEDILPQILDKYRDYGGKKRDGLYESFAEIPGVYIPSLYEVTYDSGGFITDVKTKSGARYPVKRQMVKNLPEDSHSAIVTPETEFSDIFLVEMSRGCPYSCNFCCLNLYSPYRVRKFEDIIASIDQGRNVTGKFGLLGAAVGSHPRLGDILCHIEKIGGTVSFSSLRADVLKPEIIGKLYELGQRTVTLAPETGSDQLRKSINKTLKNEDILRTAGIALDKGFMEIRLYFMAGLPGETDEDMDAAAELIGGVETLAKQKGAKVIASVNQFVPKPGTAFEREAFSPTKEIHERMKRMQKPFLKGSAVEFRVENPREMFLQAFLSRGGRSWSKYIAEYRSLSVSALGSKLRRVDDPTPDSLVFERIEDGKIPPWGIITI